ARASAAAIASARVRGLREVLGSVRRISVVLAADDLDDPDAALLADGDRLGARDQAAVDPDIERGAGGRVERDDRARPEPRGELGQAERDPAELDGELERYIVKQGVEGLRIEGVVVERFTHDLIP